MSAQDREPREALAALEQRELRATLRNTLGRAELDAEITSLVNRLTAGLLAAAEALKDDLRRETEALLAEYTRVRADLEAEIGTASTRLDEVRLTAQQEREGILGRAEADAARVEADIRATQVRLRELARQAEQERATLLEQARQEAEVILLDATSRRTEAERIAAEAAQARDRLLAEARAEAALLARAARPPDPSSPPIRPTASFPAPTTPAAPVAAPTAGLRRLVFENVAGYQQAAVIESALLGLLEDESVDIVEFEQRRLVLQLPHVATTALVEALLAEGSLPLRLIGQRGAEATLRVA